MIGVIVGVIVLIVVIIALSRTGRRRPGVSVRTATVGHELGNPLFDDTDHGPHKVESTA